MGNLFLRFLSHKMSAQEENLIGLIASETLGQAEVPEDFNRMALDMDSSEILVHGWQERQRLQGVLGSVCLWIHGLAHLSRERITDETG